MIKKKDIQLIPKEPGLYYLYNQNKELVYIGKSINLFKRLSVRVNPNCWDDLKKDIKVFSYIRYSVIKNHKLMNKEELRMINELKPIQNNIAKRYFFEEMDYSKHSLEELKATVDEVFK